MEKTKYVHLLKCLENQPERWSRSFATGNYKTEHQAESWKRFVQQVEHTFLLQLSVRGDFLPLMILTARPAIGCVKTASHRFFFWTLMDPHWRVSTQSLLSHLGLRQVIAHPLLGFLDEQQRKLTPGLCGRFCVKVRHVIRNYVLWLGCYRSAWLSMS